MSKVETILEEIKGLTLLEASDLDDGSSSARPPAARVSRHPVFRAHSAVDLPNQPHNFSTQ